MNLNEVMPKVCEAAAQAIYRYAKISRKDPKDDAPPEAFIASFVFDRLGSQFTMTLESNSKKLMKWHRNIQGQRSTVFEHQAAIETAVEQLHNGRVDLVIFDRRSDTDWQFAGLIEFKRFSIPQMKNDKVKLQRLLEQLDTCPAGAVCCLADGPCDAEWLIPIKQESEHVGDRWYCCSVPALPYGIQTRFSIFARVFTAENQLA